MSAILTSAVIGFLMLSLGLCIEARESPAGSWRFWNHLRRPVSFASIGK